MIGNHRLTIQHKSRLPDGEGGFIVDWIDLRDIWATVKPMSAKEKNDYQRIDEEVTHIVSMRYDPTIKKIYRLKFNKRIFDIQGILNVDELNREMKLFCLEVVGLR